MKEPTLTLDSIIDELLNIEKIDLKEKPNFFNRIADGVRNVYKRRDIDKAIQDEIEADKQKIITIGKSAEAFLNSPYYKQFIDSYVRANVKGSLQKLFTEYETMSEAQIKSELSGIMKCLRLVGSIRLKVLQGEKEKV